MTAATCTKLRGGLLLLALATGYAMAGTWYVDDDNYNSAYATYADYENAGLDGKTEEKAFGTIQIAVSKASSGDTIIVLPGTYDKGYETDNSYGRFRVRSTIQDLTIRSRDGKDVTHIVGSPDPTTGGLGDEAVSCIFATGNNTVVKDFTIRDGYAPDTDSAPGRGSALMGSGSRDIYLIDCVISNCQGRSTLWYGTAIRCLITGNRGRSSSSEVVGYSTKFYQSLIVGNRAPGPYTMWDGAAVNCTFADNEMGSGIHTRNASGIQHIYNCIVSYGEKITTSGTGVYRQIANTTTNTEYALVAPALDDYRVRAGGPADGTADAQWFDDFNIPEDEKWFDYTGAPIPKDAPFQQGAIQEKAQTQGGALVMYSSWMSMNGAPARACYSYAFAEAWPTQFLVKGCPANGKRIMSYHLTTSVPHSVPNVERTIRAPQLADDGYYVAPPPDSALAMGVYYNVAEQEKYVAKTGSDETGDGTAANPYLTIQKAVDESPDRTLIHVAEGTYGVGEAHYPVNKSGTEVTSYGKAALTICDRQVRIVADDGPEKTFIVGTKDLDYADDPDLPGCGPNAARCVIVCNDGINSLQGFTLTGGATARTGWGDATGGGGGCFGYNGASILTDCIISNNAASFGAGTHNAQVHRSLFADNKGTNGTVTAYGGNYSTICGCLLVGNASDRGANGTIGTSTKAFHCTIVGDSLSSMPVAVSGLSVLGNCVVSGATTVNASANTTGSIFWDVGTFLSSSVLYCDPRFADVATGDYRLLTSSPALHSTRAGAISHANWYQYVSTGYEGTPIRRIADGRFLAGALQETVAAGPEILVKADGGGLVFTGGGVGLNALSPGDSLTIGPGVGTRPCIGFAANGVTNLFADLPDGSRTFTYAETVAAAGFFVEALYDAVNWHVDAVNGNDAWPGCAAYPRRTLVGVMTNAVNGDIVHAAPGDYNEGSMIENPERVLRSRVVVTNGVTLVADQGAEVTFISGADATVDVYDSGIYKGCGANALRCVYLMPNARLRGFTVRNGRIYYTKSEHSNADSAATRSGGVYFENASAIAYDCIVTNCVGYRGGGTYSGTAVNCRFIDCKSNDGAVRTTIMYGCLIGRTYGTGALHYGRGAYNCTISDINLDSNGNNTVDAIASMQAAYPFENCLFLGRVYAREANPVVFNRCVLLTNSIPDSVSQYVTCTDCIFTNREALMLDENFRPMAGSFLIDFFATTNVNAMFEGRDVDGGQRVYNGALDVGAYEYDWRASYAHTLHPSRCSVASASPEVVQGEGKVLVTGTLDTTFTGIGGGQRYTVRVPVNVTGNGRLDVVSDGAVLASYTLADGAQTFVRKSVNSSDAYSFVYVPGESDTGCAEIGTALWKASGTSILFR